MICLLYLIMSLYLLACIVMYCSHLHALLCQREIAASSFQPVLQNYDESGLVRFLTMVIYYYQHPLAILLMKVTVFSIHLHISAMLAYCARYLAPYITYRLKIGLSRS